MPRYFWLADACEAAGLRTVEVQGWRTRGDYNFRPRGLVVHHTAGPVRGDMPSLPVLVSGRADLPGPLAQFGVARSGTVYVIAAGAANHAGAGAWHGLSGNGSVWGIEAENTGTGAEAWPAVQLDAMHRLAAVLAAKTPFGAGMVCGHKEWTTRKVDPRGIDMDAFRRKVSDLTAPAPPPAPAPPNQYPEVPMTRHDCHSPLDDQGNGYIDVAVPASAVISIVPNGDDPSGPAGDVGYKAVPRFSRLAWGNGTRIVVVGGPPRGAVDFAVWVAA